MLARLTLRVLPLNVSETWSPSFVSSSWAKASSQKVSDALSFATSESLGHFALTESAVAESLAEIVAFIAPKALQKR